jgi:hypothetical protein
MPASITCPNCHRTSFNTGDIQYKYCLKCGFHSDLKFPALTSTFCKIKPLSVNDAWKGKRFKTDEYNAFALHFNLLLPNKMEIPDGFLQIYIKWGFSSLGSDWDNPIKPMQDIISKKYGFNDNKIKRAVVDVEMVKKGREFIEFEITAL